MAFQHLSEALGFEVNNRSLDALLNEKERYVLECRWGLNGRKPQIRKVVAADLGVSISRAQQIENRCFAKLRRRMWASVVLPRHEQADALKEQGGSA